uniref:Protein PHLOEM PROTEIN 2-LIKE A1 n=1 Tax=Anthurium amnicola TaxID=1678845 RepID=A0A1D1ZCW7_9ARAE
MGCSESKFNAPPSQSLPKPPRRPEPVEEPKKPVGEEPRKSPGEQSKFDEETTRLVEHLKKFPHRYSDIVGQADRPAMGNLEKSKFSGIFLNQRRKKYWIDEKSGCNCFMLFARDLSITWSDDPRYWKWCALQETSDVCVEVAALLRVCWLDIYGRFEISHLTPGITYEVAFVVMMQYTSDGWNTPVNLRLTDPEGNQQKHLESLIDKPRGEWIELIVGELKATAASAGEIAISLFEHDDGAWKSGLIVKGIFIRPKTFWRKSIHVS